MRFRGLTTVLLVLALLLAWLNGVFAGWFQTVVQHGATADRGDYVVSAGACLATALLLFAGMIAAFVSRPPYWLLVATALGVGTQLALSITSYRHAQGMDEDTVTGTRTFGHGFARAFELPGSWPLLAVLVVAAVAALRGWSSPARRRPQDR